MMRRTPIPSLDWLDSIYTEELADALMEREIKLDSGAEEAYSEGMETKAKIPKNDDQ